MVDLLIVMPAALDLAWAAVRFACALHRGGKLAMAAGTVRRWANPAPPERLDLGIADPDAVWRMAIATPGKD